MVSSPFLFYFYSSVSICFLVYLLFCWFDAALLLCFSFNYFFFSKPWSMWERTRETDMSWQLVYSQRALEFYDSQPALSQWKWGILLRHDPIKRFGLWRRTILSDDLIFYFFLVPHPSQAFADSSHCIVLFLRLYCQCTQSTLNLSSCGILLWPRPRRHAPATLQAQYILEKGI